MTYDEDLKVFIRNNLSRFINGDDVEKFLTDDAMRKWKQAFTHASFSPTNYEIYEKDGDAKADAILHDIFKVKIPGLKNENDYAGLINYYHSEEFFSELGIKEGFETMLRASKEIIENEEAIKKIAEDLFEAFIGGLTDVGNDVGKQLYGVRFGYNYAEQYLIHIFNGIDVDLAHVAGSYKNQLTEIMKNFRIPLQRIQVISGISDVTLYFYISKSIFEEILKRLDKELVLDAARDRELASIFSRKSMYGADKYVFLGKATATRKEKAEIAASKVALDYLQEVYDINRNTAEQVKLEIIGEREPDELQYLKSIYSDITFPSAQIYGDKAYYYITGVRNKKRINITIYTTSPHINFNTARTNLIEKAYRKVKKQAELTE